MDVGFFSPQPVSKLRDFNEFPRANGVTSLSDTANSSLGIINTSTSNSGKRLDKYFNIRVELNYSKSTLLTMR